MNDVELLRAPLFDGQDFDDAWAGRCAELATGGRLTQLYPLNLRDALIILLRSSFSASKVQHLMRIPQEAVSRLTNCDLSDEQWRHFRSSLAVSERVSSLALPDFFLASAATILQLQTTILAQNSTVKDPISAACLEQWRSTSFT